MPYYYEWRDLADRYFAPRPPASVVGIIPEGDGPAWPGLYDLLIQHVKTWASRVGT